MFGHYKDLSRCAAHGELPEVFELFYIFDSKENIISVPQSQLAPNSHFLKIELVLSW